MKGVFFKGALLVLFSGILWQCSTVPFTGRKQVNLLPESEMVSMGISNYRAFLDTTPVVTRGTEQALVKKVGGKIAAAVENFFQDNQQNDRLQYFDWEFQLVEDEVPNAWCMPGGKVVFYTGILPYCRDEEGMAVVMGHEIAHAVARHGNERMSQALLVQMGGIALSVAIDQKPEETKQWFMAAYGITSSLGVILPYSRAHETEADQLGLIFMTMAGYHPESAIDFWERLAAAGGRKPPEFLSTHPSDEKRIRDMKAFLPKARKYQPVHSE
ncbi:MAG TPA: M48 family peptidase [Bacteroidetes bacterium]|nr:M48 family peptidase [Bacteroidota bacterium]